MERRRKTDVTVEHFVAVLEKLTQLIEEQGTTEADRMLDTSPDGVLLVNKHGVITRANRRAETMFWYSTGGMRSMPVEFLVPEDVRERHSAHLAGYFQAPRVREMGVGLLLNGLRADGTQFPVEIALAPFHEPGQDLRTMAVIRDKTERGRSDSYEL